jgi:hypothetical protein
MQQHDVCVNLVEERDFQRTRHAAVLFESLFWLTFAPCPNPSLLHYYSRLWSQRHRMQSAVVPGVPCDAGACCSWNKTLHIFAKNKAIAFAAELQLQQQAGGQSASATASCTGFQQTRTLMLPAFERPMPLPNLLHLTARYCSTCMRWLWQSLTMMRRWPSTATPQGPWNSPSPLPSLPPRVRTWRPSLYRKTCTR